MGGCNSNKNKQIIKSEAYKFPGSSIRRLYHVSKSVVGRGAFATVFKGKNLVDPSIKVAIKSYNAKNSADMKAIENEITVLSKLDHPNIVKNYYLCLEYVKGETLSDLLEKNKNGLPEADAAHIMSQLVSAINHCHANNIAHRDIKPDNIMIDSKLRVKLIDFGLSKVFSTEEHLKSKAGSPLFMAPETTTGDYTYKCDIWSLGILMYILLSGRLPFYGKSSDEVLKQSLLCNLGFDEELWKNTSPEAIDLMSQMICLDPEVRPTCSKIMQHEWFDLIRDDTTDDSVENNDCPILDSLLNFRCNSKLVLFSLISLIKMKNSERKIQELYSEFKKIDTKGEGMISETELKNAFDKQNMDVSQKELKQIFQTLDLSKNGFINFSEFLVATLPSSAIHAKLIKTIFDQFDSDSDGKVDKEDILRDFLLMGYDISKAELKQVFRTHDPKNRGYLTYHDFTSMVLSS